jgi:hypothetical protein
MRLLADVCHVHILLVGEDEEVVVARGAAMLGRFAAEVSKRGGVEAEAERAKLLWDIMVNSTLSFRKKKCSRCTSVAGQNDTSGDSPEAVRISSGRGAVRCQVQDLPRVNRDSEKVETRDGKGCCVLKPGTNTLLMKGMSMYW